MRKYLEVFHIGIKEQMAYKFDMITSSVFAIFKVLLAYILWSAIFNGRDMVAGYTFPMMMTYYLFVSFAVQMNRGQDVVFQFSGEIRSGQFTKYVVRPISPIGVFMALSASKSAVIFVLNMVAFTFWSILFKGILYVPNVIHVFIGLGFMLVGLIIIHQVYYLITMFSFKIIEIGGLLFALLNIFSFLSGELIPLDLLPDGIEMIVRVLPFYYIIYYPASIILGGGLDGFWVSVFIQLFWLILITGVNQFMYKKLFSHYEGVGV